MIHNVLTTLEFKMIFTIYLSFCKVILNKKIISYEYSPTLLLSAGFALTWLISERRCEH